MLRGPLTDERPDMMKRVVIWVAMALIPIVVRYVMRKARI
jgi:hypothetical protein